MNPTTAATAAAAANINYGAGIFDLEKGAEGSWRWVGEQGTIKLKNNKGDMRLKIAGSAPIDLIHQPSQVTIKLNGEQLEQTTLTKEKNKVEEKDYTFASGVFPAFSAFSGRGNKTSDSATFAPFSLGPHSSSSRHCPAGWYPRTA